MKDSSFLVFVAVVSYSRHLGALVRNDASPVAAFGIVQEQQWVVATRMFADRGVAQTYAAELQRQLDVQLNAEVDSKDEEDFSRYEALVSSIHPYQAEAI